MYGSPWNFFPCRAEPAFTSYRRFGIQYAHYAPNQKCDRQIPCGLCTTRGIPHLCRWEPIVVRPTPQRPPTEAISVSANATIEALSARIAALEQALKQQQHGTVNGDDTPNPTGTPSGSQTPEFIPEPSAALSLSAGESNEVENEERPHALIDHDVQVAAVALAQLSLAPKAEYVGSGTVLCALHRVSPTTTFSVASR